jgi:MarR family transcriptional regulator, lower aerobic nicotinate degradation pathway regulator
MAPRCNRRRADLRTPRGPWKRGGNALTARGDMANKIQVSELTKHIGYWMRFVSNHVSHAFMLKVEARGVTVAEWAAMRQMLASGPTNPSQLAQQMGMTRGAISKLVDRLCAKGMARRIASDGDRRYQSVSLTAKGQKLIPTLARLADKNDDEFFGYLTDEVQHDLVKLLKEVVQHHGWIDVPVS